MRVICLWAAILLGTISLSPAASVRIHVDNQTYDTVYLSRIGDPQTSVLVPKRMAGDFQVPLVGQDSPALEILEVTFPSNIVVPETDFRGFNGKYGQSASLTVASPQDISIAYDQGSASTTSDSPTNTATATTATGDDYYGGGDVAPGINYGAHPPMIASNPVSPEADNGIMETPPKRIIVAKNTGAHIKIADPRYASIEAPVPVRAKPEIAKAPPASPIPPPVPEQKANYRALVTWIVVCLALAGFVAWKRFSSR